MEGFALDLQARFPRTGIQHLLLTVVGAPMMGNLQCASQDANRSVGGHQSERPADRFWRDGVIVEIAHIDRLVQTRGLDPVRAEWMQRRRQQAKLFLGENVGDDAVVLSRPAPLVRHLVAPQPGLAIAFGQRGEGPSGPEGIAHIADGPFHPRF